MSPGAPWIFHQNELQRLNEAYEHARMLCFPLAVMFHAIREDSSDLGVSYLEEFLEEDHESQRNLTRCLDEVGHFLKWVATPVHVPSSPTSKNEFRADSAHHAALAIFRGYRWYFGIRAMPCISNVGIDPADDASRLVDTNWREIRRELLPFCKFDLRRLIRSIEAETRAAIELSRATAIKAAQVGGSISCLENERDFRDPTSRQSGKGLSLANEWRIAAYVREHIVETDGNGDEETPPLNNNQKYALVAMLELKAYDANTRKVCEEIANCAAGVVVEAASWKHVMSDLNKLKLVDSKVGRGGGYWLTDRGRRVAELLK